MAKKTTAAVTALDKPVATLDATPDVKSHDDVDLALQELGFLSALEASINARCKTEVDALQKKYSDELVVDVRGENVGIADRRQKLQEAVASYCKKKRKTVLDGPKKSRDFTHGAVGWKSSSVSYVFDGDNTPKGLLERVEKQLGLAAKLVAWLKRQTVFGVRLDRFIELKPAIRITAVKAAVEAGEITPAALKKLGMKVEQGSETFYVKPADYTVRSERSAA